MKASQSGPAERVPSNSGPLMIPLKQCQIQAKAPAGSGEVLPLLGCHLALPDFQAPIQLIRYPRSSKAKWLPMEGRATAKPARVSVATALFGDVCSDAKAVTVVTATSPRTVVDYSSAATTGHFWGTHWGAGLRLRVLRYYSDRWKPQAEVVPCSASQNGQTGYEASEESFLPGCEFIFRAAAAA